jgi:hypothetical protein
MQQMVIVFPRIPSHLVSHEDTRAGSVFSEEQHTRLSRRDLLLTYLSDKLIPGEGQLQEAPSGAKLGMSHALPFAD